MCPRNGSPSALPAVRHWQPRGAQPADGYILFFGTLEPRKNLGTLLDAYEILLSRRTAIPELLLAGKPTEQSAPWLERIARPPLARAVRHIGYVRPDDRNALYAGARLLVQPSFEEGFGLPVLEAMSIGVPVVAADAGALPEVGGDAVMLTPATDPCRHGRRHRAGHRRRRADGRHGRTRHRTCGHLHMEPHRGNDAGGVHAGARPS
ncbi:MAG: glycosyltransferase [Vicinamibacterales bacterium]